MNLAILPVTMQDIRDAQKVLAGRIYNTSILRSNYLSEICQGDIYIKFENMQRTGSFKIRGAFNKISSLNEEEAKRGVVACSAGNHAQGVALSGTMLGINTKIVMPESAPKSKIAATIGYGAEVVLYGANFNDTLKKAQEIVEEEGRVFIPPYDDTKVIAGQGTIGIEILEEIWDVDNVIVPIGGGGLISGIAVALKSFNPNINIAANQLVSHRVSATVADGCDVATPGKMTYDIVKELVTKIVTVSEEDIIASMIALVQRNKIISEGAGALSTAALLSGKISEYIEGQKTVVILSGGNIDLSRLAEILQE